MDVINKNNYQNSFEISFSMNKGTFFGDVLENELTTGSYQTIANRFIELTNAKYQGFANAQFKSPKTIVVTFKTGLHNKLDIDAYIDVINTMYTAYLVSARIRNNQPYKSQ